MGSSILNLAINCALGKSLVLYDIGWLTVSIWWGSKFDCPCRRSSEEAVVDWGSHKEWPCGRLWGRKVDSRCVGVVHSCRWAGGSASGWGCRRGSPAAKSGTGLFPLALGTPQVPLLQAIDFSALLSLPHPPGRALDHGVAGGQWGRPHCPTPTGAPTWVGCNRGDHVGPTLPVCPMWRADQNVLARRSMLKKKSYIRLSIVIQFLHALISKLNKWKLIIGILLQTLCYQIKPVVTIAACMKMKLAEICNPFLACGFVCNDFLTSEWRKKEIKAPVPN